MAELGVSILPMDDKEDQRLALHVSKLPLEKLKDIMCEGQGRLPYESSGSFPKIIIPDVLSESIRYQVQNVIPSLYSNLKESGKKKIFNGSTSNFRDYLFKPGLGLLMPEEAGVMRCHPRMWRTLCINHCFRDLNYDDGQLKRLAFEMLHTPDVQRTHYIVNIVDEVAEKVAEEF